MADGGAWLVAFPGAKVGGRKASVTSLRYPSSWRPANHHHRPPSRQLCYECVVPETFRWNAGHVEMIYCIWAATHASYARSSHRFCFPVFEGCDFELVSHLRVKPLWDKTDQFADTSGQRLISKFLFLFPPSACTFRQCFLFQVCGTLHNSNNVVSLGEEGHPVVERLLLLVVQIMPIGAHILGLGRCLAESL
jgi:hypothetical protein